MKLTKDTVVEAFRETGLAPIRGSFGDGSVVCGMAAYARMLDLGSVYVPKLKQMFGRAYFEGWTHGWDGGRDMSDAELTRRYGIVGSMRWYDGREDGADAYAEVTMREQVAELAQGEALCELVGVSSL